MSLKRWVWDKYRGICCYCGKRLAIADATVDHFLPFALGGDNRKRNLRLACSQCNGAKADMHPREWLARNPTPPTPPPTRQEVRTALLDRIAKAYRERYGPKSPPAQSLAEDKSHDPATIQPG